MPSPKQKLIHVHADPDELGRVYQPQIGLACRAADFVAVAAKLTQGMVQKSPVCAKESYMKWQEPSETPGDVKMEQVICHMRDVLPKMQS